jgi:hypothetical protein
MLHIASIPGHKLDRAITIEAKRLVVQDHRGDMMHPGTSGLPHVIIGVAVMGTMMIAFMGARGGMF